MIKKDGGQFFDSMGGHSCYEGDIELMGVPSVGKTLILPWLMLLLPYEQ